MADDDRKRRSDPGLPGTAVITKTKPQIKRPNLYRVLILNDDYTPMEFVVHVIERFFGKDHEAANRIMLHVHNHGIGECGVYTYEVAETKVTQVMDFARKHQHPLQCVMEKKYIPALELKLTIEAGGGARPLKIDDWTRNADFFA
jgi:ATP-dependent Clp protease adaptor protein ClpS